MDYDLQLSLGTKVLPLSFPEKRRWPESPDSMAPSTVKRTKSAVKGIDVNKLPTEDWDVAGVEEEATISSPVSAVSSVSAEKRPPREETDENDRGDCSGGEPTATSTASDDDEGENGSKKKLRLSKEQSSVLEESFKKHSTLNPKQKLALSSVVNLTPRQVEVWFQNRRARTKLKQTEWDCEYLKRYCEKLTEENRRLHIDVNELRTLRLSQSPNLFAPPTTISICQLCQQTSTGTINPQPQEADAVKEERKSGNGIEWRCPAPPQKQPHVFFPHRPTAMLAWSSTSTGSVVPFPDARSQR